MMDDFIMRTRTLYSKNIKIKALEKQMIDLDAYREKLERKLGRDMDKAEKKNQKLYDKIDKIDPEY